MASSCLSFPQRVYNALRFCEEQGRQDIISWEKDGTAFTVNDLQEFKRDLLPGYFNTKKYYTFTRSLYAYGFTCVRTGRQPGIYSHPNFKRDDPLSPSLMKRVSRKKSTKVAAPIHAVSNLSVAELNNRTFSLRMTTGASNDQQSRCKFPSLLDETGREYDSDTATVFGLLFHTIAGTQVPEPVTSRPVRIPPGSELLGIFDDEEDSMDAQSYPNPTPSTSNTNQTTLFHTISSSYTTATGRQMSERKPITPSGSLVMVGSVQNTVAPIERVVSPRNVMHGLEQDNQTTRISCHAPKRPSRLQQQNHRNVVVTV